MKKEILRQRRGYLVLRSEGLCFLEKWFKKSKRLPPNLVKLYQLLLHMVTLNGVIPVYLALRIGYTLGTIDVAVSKRYIELSSAPKKPSEEVLKKIKEIIGKPPREIIV